MIQIAVREVHIESLPEELKGLGAYSRALIVYRYRGAVVGQATVPVHDGRVLGNALRNSITVEMAWHVWTYTTGPQAGPECNERSSVVVCTRDRAHDLAQCLPSLRKYALAGHEVIVLDSCPSDDSTFTLVATYPELRYIHEPRPGLGLARNTAIRAASCELIAFTDDDAMVDDNWLAALLRNFTDPMVAVVLGITLPQQLETVSQVWFERTNGFARGLERRTADLTTRNPLYVGGLGAGVSTALRRSVAQEIGLFDELLGPGTRSLSGDDHEFYYRVLARGYRIVYDPAAVAWHRHRREWEALRHTIYGYGVGVFSWWTRALVIEKEWGVPIAALKWFFSHCVLNVIWAILKRNGSPPLDLAWAEFRGALAGPFAYLGSLERRPISSSQSPKPLRFPGDST